MWLHLIFHSCLFSARKSFQTSKKLLCEIIINPILTRKVYFVLKQNRTENTPAGEMLTEDKPSRGQRSSDSSVLCVLSYL